MVCAGTGILARVQPTVGLPSCRDKLVAIRLSSLLQSRDGGRFTLRFPEFRRSLVNLPRRTCNLGRGYTVCIGKFDRIDHSGYLIPVR
jgi:hypothetical protein